MFIYFSELQNRPVVDKNHHPVGVLDDIIVKTHERYPKSEFLVVGRGGLKQGAWSVLHWDHVVDLAPGFICLNLTVSQIRFSGARNHKSDLSLRQDILDQQVVDMNNQNVIRVNDIHLLQADQDLIVAHVDIGLRGIIRRLGFEGIIDFFVRLSNRNSVYLNRPRLISWKNIQPLSINPASMTIKVNAAQKQFADMSPADLGEIMEDLPPKNRLTLFRGLDLMMKSQIFKTLDFKAQKSLLDDLSQEEGVEILAHLPMDEVVDFLSELPKTTVDRYLGLMESKTAKQLTKLLSYSGESAGGLMTTEFLAVPDTATVEEALRIVKENTPKVETIQYLFVVDKDNHLVGSTVLRRLIMANPEDSVMKAVMRKTVSIHIDDEVKKIAFLMEKYTIYVLPVVDSNNILVGIITIDDIFSRLVAIAWGRTRDVL